MAECCDPDFDLEGWEDYLPAPELAELAALEELDPGPDAHPPAPTGPGRAGTTTTGHHGEPAQQESVGKGRIE